MFVENVVFCPSHGRFLGGAFYQAHVIVEWIVLQHGDDDSGDGSVENPFRTIQHAVDISNYLDTVIVENGQYSENVRVEDKNIALASRHLFTGDSLDIQNTIIDGGSAGSVIFISNCDRLALIRGLTLRNGYNSYGGGLCCEYASPEISYNFIHDNTGYYYGGAISITGNSNSIIVNNEISDNNSGYGGGISCNSNTVCRNNIIINNSAIHDGGGIYAAGSSIIIANKIGENTAYNGGGISCSLFSSAFIYGNMIYSNQASRRGGGMLYDNSCSAPLYNNVFSDIFTIIGFH